MQTQKNLMLLNPVVTWAYGAWFIIQPDGYLRYIGGQTEPVTPAIMTVFVSFGAMLLILGYMMWLLRQQTTEATLFKNMGAFGSAWFITAGAIFFSMLAYLEDPEAYLLPLIEAALFSMVGAFFFAKRSELPRTATEWSAVIQGRPLKSPPGPQSAE